VTGRPAAAPGRAGRLAAGAALLLALALAPRPGWPHASLVRSAPARRATLVRAPDRVQLWFSERLEGRFSRLSVWDGAGRQVDFRDVRVDADDPKKLSVGLPPLAPGAYLVRFRVLSVDGHVVEAEFPFTVRAP
jgi:methionine-rich copper-binding protein CopC